MKFGSDLRMYSAKRFRSSEVRVGMVASSVFPLAEQHVIRNRLAKSFRYIVSQRLIPRKEILKSTLRTREYVEKGEGEGKTLLDAMRVGGTEGMQHFDREIEKLMRDETIDFETGMAYATNAGNLRLELADFMQAATPVAHPTPVE
jgi:twitching motility protein PilT